MKRKWDAIVVGAGIGGLSCASLLSRHGMKVLVLERHDRVGGYGHDFVRRARNGVEYRFDVALHFTLGLREGGPFRAIMEDMGVFDKLTIRQLDSVLRMKFPDFAITMPSSIVLFKERLIALFQRQKERIEKLFETFERIHKEMLDATANGRIRELARGELSIEYPTASRYRSSSIEEVVKDHVENNHLASTMYPLVFAFGVKPARSSALVYVPLLYELLLRGAEYIEGGGYAYAHAMRDAIKRSGGEVLTKAEVERIVVEDGRCAGVKTKEGKRFESPVIVCNAPAPVAFKTLLDGSLASSSYVEKVLQSEVSPSAIKAFVGVRGTPDELGCKESDYIVYGSYDLNSEFDALMAGDYAAGPFVLSNNTVVNPGSTPEGRSILHYFTLADGEAWCGLPTEVYTREKGKLTEVIIDRIGEVIPDIRERMEVIEVCTPHTMERYTLNPNGAVFGYAQTRELHSVFNPDPRTPVKGLFLASAWTYPGVGFAGATMGGANAARMILGQGA